MTSLNRLRKLLMLAGLGVAPMVVSCSLSAAVWVEPGSTIANLRISYAEKRGTTRPLASLQDIRIAPCTDDASLVPAAKLVWGVRAPADPLRNVAGTFTYGVPPAGMIVVRPPQPLSAGCYVVVITGVGISASECFDIRPDGTVLALTGVECDARRRNGAGP